ncbi:MAG: hypothetical protein JAZ06_02450 [Candidatus Thiodiazotropha taylori]|nr:hypothetical protein [Candidatus Thiodiazotropha taylori]
MDRIFKQREDWFEVGVVPKIRRRNIIGALLIGLFIAISLFLNSWVPLVFCIVVIAERVFELAHISKTKEIISSLKIQATDKGLSFFGSGINGSVVYPWTSLKFKVENNNVDELEEIVIEDRNRKGSKQKIVGYEGMSELFTLIEGNAKKP